MSDRLENRSSTVGWKNPFEVWKRVNKNIWFWHRIKIKDQYEL